MKESTIKRAIDNRKLVYITFSSYEKGLIKRICVSFDIGPSRRYKDGRTRYHFYDLNSPDGKHTLSILPEQLINIEITDETFEPIKYVNWTPNWFYPRDWGNCS